MWSGLLRVRAAGPPAPCTCALNPTAGPPYVTAMILLLRLALPPLWQLAALAPLRFLPAIMVCRRAVDSWRRAGVLWWAGCREAPLCEPVYDS